MEPFIITKEQLKQTKSGLQNLVAHICDTLPNRPTEQQYKQLREQIIAIRTLNKLISKLLK